MYSSQQPIAYTRLDDNRYPCQLGYDPEMKRGWGKILILGLIVVRVGAR